MKNIWKWIVVMLKQHGCGERPIFEEGVKYSRIIEGVEAGIGEFPWLVSIQAGNQHFCGGAILNKWWILTAAHCFHYEELSLTAPAEPVPKVPRTICDLGFSGIANSSHFVTFPFLPCPIFTISPVELSVVAGTNDLTNPYKEIKGVTKIILHKDFKKVNMDNDVALLLVDSPITFSDQKIPICLPRQPIPSTWHQCLVAGWGQTNTDDKNSMTTDLMKVPMIIMDWEECSKKFPKLTKNMLCAGYKNESYDACQGDSGGPLVCTPGPGKKWYQVGIISWGKSCGHKNIPGIYTWLVKYDLWIKNVTEMEGRPFIAEEMRAPPKQKLRSSQASEFSEPSSPKFWLLLCLLPYMLFWPIFNC
ncbi:serine protease 55 [Loxodonta africana]|uniref:serine protease 55 n=1 Tax=Loxodonta africana TaxID=9785 RepID=UPI000C812F81|nr:serine protease 55 [Loxodonta africana]